MKEKILEKLKDCYDPEIPVNIVDLGLIYEIKIENKKAKIKMTLTNPFCPVLDALIYCVKQKACEVKGIEDAEVEIVFDPPWTPDKMSKEAKKKLGLL